MTKPVPDFLASTNKELGQYPVILTLALVNNLYVMLCWTMYYNGEYLIMYGPVGLCNVLNDNVLFKKLFSGM